ncbi:MAG: LysR family transcriptional regulator [Planctomycetes bacterium]|nr:LysR family transcriptional regulator [Planctomycetota bacterium]HPF13200.1 LysR family transcriptional regulator [Planctomycetota bacterium]HRV79866.1 LysR family transcriptional regulator [Planctomycetota bacterium]
MSSDHLNYHHLHYFWAVAKDGNLTRTARRMHVSQSALSAQIRQLEERLGEALFLREGRRLVLTEAGQLALDMAEPIFDAGRELVATLQSGRTRQEPLRLGAVSTLSRNFQESFVKPLLGAPEVRLRLLSGRAEDLLQRLARHELDLVLANQPARKGSGTAWRSRRVARQPVSIVGRPRAKAFRFPQDLGSAPMILPVADSAIRAEFDALCDRLNIRIQVLAEVEDMATMRLLARDTEAHALVPSVVVRDELRSGVLREHCVVPDLFESFYAITVDRRYQHPLLEPLLAREEADILAMENPEGSAQ